jgi:hypothetical protein
MFTPLRDAWRLTWGSSHETPVIVKLGLPPQQSWGVSQIGLGAGKGIRPREDGFAVWGGDRKRRDWLFSRSPRASLYPAECLRRDTGASNESIVDCRFRIAAQI